MTDPGEKPKVGPARIGVWVVVGAIGAYMVISGVVGALNVGG